MKGLFYEYFFVICYGISSYMPDYCNMVCNDRVNGGCQMSIVIKGMQIPGNCTKCHLMCALRHFNILTDNRPDDCPLVEIPQHHGRLIDADALKTWFGEKDLYSYDYIVGIINDEPTIIEAEGADE
jgi:hypothetical protein